MTEDEIRKKFARDADRQSGLSNASAALVGLTYFMQ
jgi:hypothetical protein